MAAYTTRTWRFIKHSPQRHGCPSKPSAFAVYIVDMHSGGLSRQDTLPAEDISWSYTRVPGQPAPIPPRNEPLLYIHNSIVNSDYSHATASCLKNLQPKIPPTTPSEKTLNNVRTDGTTDHVETTISAINFPQVCTLSRVLLFPRDWLT